MKQALTRLLTEAVGELCRRGALRLEAAEAAAAIHLERARNPAHGDFACNLAMVLAKQTGDAPRELAAQILAALPESAVLEKAELAGPGFINFFVTPTAYHALVPEIRDAGARYGSATFGDARKVLVEFVSANPTGPLHVGHGRGAAYGDAVARLLAAVGYDVRREYYVNDAGRQMDILALSLWLRYLEIGGDDRDDDGDDFPDNGYRGDYVRDLANELHREHGDAYRVAAGELFLSLPDEPESRMDELIARCKSALGEKSYRAMFDYGCNAMVGQIRDDLTEFGVSFDEWFSERVLVDGGDVKRALAALDKNGHIYVKDGVTWFRAQDFGDEKDRAVLRANGSHTYFASDIAYHFNKAERGFETLVDVFGADHHGYAERIKASFAALGFARARLQVRLVQFAALYRGKEKIQMSTRAGEFVTLRALVDEIGADAARFFYVSRKNDRHMDFDLDLAKAQSSDNPVYYVQYAHARICSVFQKLADGDGDGDSNSNSDDAPDYALLTEADELSLMKTLSRFPEVVAQAARSYEPHLLAFYLRELANDFHAYYNAHPFLSSENNLRRARLGLIDATRQVIANGLQLLGVRAPENM